MTEQEKTKYRRRNIALTISMSSCEPMKVNLMSKQCFSGSGSKFQGILQKKSLTDYSRSFNKIETRSMVHPRSFVKNTHVTWNSKWWVGRAPCRELLFLGPPCFLDSRKSIHCTSGRKIRALENRLFMLRRWQDRTYLARYRGRNGSETEIFMLGRSFKFIRAVSIGSLFFYRGTIQLRRKGIRKAKRPN